jgi:hypothetical protein
VLIDCSSGAQPQGWCPTTADEMLPPILGVLPEGPAWQAAHVDQTIQNKFWRSVANEFANVSGRFCDFMKEFHCSTALESLDQWNTEYYLPDACDPYAFNLCAKVNAYFDGTCTGFVDLAKSNGWVITCDDEIVDPIAGACMAGCVSMGPQAELTTQGSNLGADNLCGCYYGSVVEHPEPEYWDNSFTSKATCTVPGSNLGQGPEDYACCFIVGYYEAPTQPTLPTPGGPCELNDTIYFGCPRPTASNHLILQPCDTTGSWTNYSNAYGWNVVVHMKSSYALQNKELTVDPVSAAGCFEVGCTPLCSQQDTSFIDCLLKQVAPAHMNLVVTLDYSS